jgi:hypothetical protein
MSDLDAALERVREIPARRAAARKELAAIRVMLDQATALLTKPPAAPAAMNGSVSGNGSASENGYVALDRATFDQNLVDVAEIAKRLRDAAH